MLYTETRSGQVRGGAFHRARNTLPTHPGQSKLKPIQTYNMKKTLIALLALAGVAAAADPTVGTVDTIVASWGTAPALAGNCWSGDYTLTFTLDERYTLEHSGSVVGFYRGSAVNDTYGYNAIVLGGTDEALTLTVGRGRVYDTVDNATGIDNVTYVPLSMPVALSTVS